MRTFIDALRRTLTAPNPTQIYRAFCAVAVLSIVATSARCQTPAPDQSPAPVAPAAQTPTSAQTPAPVQTPASGQHQPEPTQTAAAAQPDAHPLPAKDPVLSQGAFTVQTTAGEIKEDQFKQLLVGKTMYLRAGYQDNNLEFDEHGKLLGHSAQGSFTLSQIQINKVKLSKRKLELVGDRYGLHFLGAAPYEDPTAATDRVKITPKKKIVRITFNREEVKKPKKKDKGEGKKKKHHAKSEPSETADSASPVAPEDHPTEKKGEIAANATQASQLLLSALDSVFSVGTDERMIAAMPEFWKLYYQAAQAKTDYKPTDPGVLREGAVEQKARLISALDPPSNEFAQANGVAGIALYHAVIGSDGKVEEVVAGRPIGFGLDENAAQTIRKATFQPAMKDGKPVRVAVDLVVSFRIYSKRTSQPTANDASQKPAMPVLPGPYTAEAAASQASSTRN
jgi:outer membrane biosynthesis protein TonB